MAEIVLQQVYKTYDPGLFKKKIKAVRGLSFAVEKGEVFGLIGPNGAGKSTTIRLLLGLTRPDCGTILFRGKQLDQSGIRSEIGYLPENPYLYDNLTLADLLHFGARVSGRDPDACRRRSQQLVERLGMEESLKRPMRTFSKGMRQRAGICYALLHDPSVVVLDEPMSGLDPLGRKLFFDLIMELKGAGKTIFFCSHILSDVERLCDHIGLLARGRLVKSFEKHQFAENPLLPVHLLVTPLSGQQREALKKAGVEMSVEQGGDLLSLGAGHVSSVGKLLKQLGVSVVATRTSRVSLESLFLEAVQVGGGENE